MLKEKIDKHKTDVYLVNTGWSGGPYGIGKRIKLSYTRSIVRAAIKGDLNNVNYDKEPYFNLMIPQECPGVPREILNPVNTWEDREAFQKQAERLAKLFEDNYSNLKFTVIN
jgi:phosphoenolpyruvate carboxykinase (ATP)